MKKPKGSAVDHPAHYNIVPGIECIDVVEHFNFNRGNSIKYIWRAGLKGDVIEDLEKAVWYVSREIARIKKEQLTCQKKQKAKQKNLLQMLSLKNLKANLSLLVTKKKKASSR